MPRIHPGGHRGGNRGPEQAFAPARISVDRVVGVVAAAGLPTPAVRRIPAMDS